MTKQEIDTKNLQDILDRVKGIQGLVYQKEVREIVAKFPDANNFEICEKTEGEVKSFHGKKIRNYTISEDTVYVLLAHSERGEGKKKKSYSRYLKFNIDAIQDV